MAQVCARSAGAAANTNSAAANRSQECNFVMQPFI
jgi:hypothetical protein